MSASSAIQWLLEHDGDSDTDDSVPSATGGTTSDKTATSETTQVKDEKSQDLETEHVEPHDENVWILVHSG